MNESIVVRPATESVRPAGGPGVLVPRVAPWRSHKREGENQAQRQNPSCKRPLSATPTLIGLHDADRKSFANGLSSWRVERHGICP
jgi:hypothetical protein